ncbi:NADH:ubiquinone oxidoreductase subunit 6 chain J [Serpentinimonas maccroryi]|uniref:NADH-quinone oxidoreductase subunit J n=1 Tax=Serpentinimonas maccroryi TaxID=1458426 RepID=A0A060NQ85_9BURK|nr:NADH-quinone oxidoreductase subunit J [Serpentinimonas maccroryi]BAO83525.1 NADH:ubiquinone oxidoreductase subunit 6 chain J [Serpentinimonas maccroryi]
MDFQAGFFYVFAALLLFAAFKVITARNAVHAVLYLMLAFSQAAAIFLLLKAEFLAITLVLVYLGAVMVLFLFVVMMMDINTEVLRKGFWRHFPITALLGAVISVQLIVVLWFGFPQMTVDPAVLTRGMHVPGHENTLELGLLLYSVYLYPVQIAGVILLVGMIAAIALVLRERKDSKAIDPGVQVRVKASDRLQVLHMQPTPKPGPAPADQAKEGQP